MISSSLCPPSRSRAILRDPAASWVRSASEGRKEGRKEGTSRRILSCIGLRRSRRSCKVFEHVLRYTPHVYIKIRVGNGSRNREMLNLLDSERRREARVLFLQRFFSQKVGVGTRVEESPESSLDFRTQPQRESFKAKSFGCVTTG